MVVSCVLAIVLAMAIPSVIKLWYAIGTTLVPGLLVPLVTSYFDGLRADAKTAFRSMLGGWLTSLLWLLAGWQLAVWKCGVVSLRDRADVSRVCW